MTPFLPSIPWFIHHKLLDPFGHHEFPTQFCCTSQRKLNYEYDHMECDSSMYVDSHIIVPNNASPVDS